VWNISNLINSKNEASKVVKTDRVFESYKDYVFCVYFSPDKQYLASRGDNYNVLIWDLDHSNNKGKKTPNKTGLATILEASILVSILLVLFRYS